MEITPVKQYQIVLVNLDPTLGSEMKKTRPCVVISPDEMNKYLQTIVIAPMTSISKSYPTRVAVKHNRTKGWIVLDQIRTIDRIRIVKSFNILSNNEIMKVKRVLHETYVD
jgi:mRNA interferase MazF